MTDRSALDALKNQLTAVLTGTNDVAFPLTAALTELGRRTDERRAALVALGAKGEGRPAFQVLGLADVVSVAAAGGIKHLANDEAGQPIEILVDLLAHAEATRALWYDLFVGAGQQSSSSGEQLLLETARQLVAESAACAARFGIGSGQLLDFAREKSLLG